MRRVDGLDCKIFFHDNGFDGACSASLFTRFHRECVKTADTFSYQGLVHRAGALFDEADFGAGENAIVDFKYSPSPEVTWWFDHHLSAFMTPEDQANFEQGQARLCGSLEKPRKFYDPSYMSCTGLIMDVAASKFGFNPKGLEELRRWADIVDGAKMRARSRPSRWAL